METNKAYILSAILLIAFAGVLSTQIQITGYQIMTTGSPYVVLSTNPCSAPYLPTSPATLLNTNMFATPKTPNPISMNDYTLSSGVVSLYVCKSSSSIASMTRTGTVCPTGMTWLVPASTQTTIYHYISPSSTTVQTFCSSTIGGQQAIFLRDVTLSPTNFDPTQSCPTGYISQGIIKSDDIFTNQPRYLEFCTLMQTPPSAPSGPSGTSTTGATCSDGIWNGDESDQDCGGSCQTCPPPNNPTYLSCWENSDCTTGYCYFSPTVLARRQSGSDNFIAYGARLSPIQAHIQYQGVCQTPSSTPTCSDGIYNQDETDIDCGGNICSNKCTTSKGCKLNSDCASNQCFTQSLDCPGGGQGCSQRVCAAPSYVPVSCYDGIKNQQETDIDCGGTCQKCGLGKTCNLNSDCTTGNNCVSGVCKVPAGTVSCLDGIKNQQESDIDCGGPNCAACSTGKTCTANSDCSGTTTCISNICTIPTSTTTAADDTDDEDSDVTSGDSSSSSSSSTGPVCGDGQKEYPEQCDDANLFDEDGCSRGCFLETCGDRIVQRGLGEQCDPPNGKTCSINCKFITESTPEYERVTLPTNMPRTDYVTQTPQKRSPWIAILILLVLLIAVGLWWLKKQGKDKKQYELPVKYPYASKATKKVTGKLNNKRGRR